ncbi:MAG: DUF4160 domain-containing protein [Candidatus Caenarcaniphilales bacterium]|nr:DUF4160 domain-containing protein [Candidatus Caenarcaniphilales bacterium]
MSPTLFRYKGFRFFFFSREEPRIHVHISSPDGEAKFWLEPKIELAYNYKLSDKEINDLEKAVKEHQDEIKETWRKHFRS